MYKLNLTDTWFHSNDRTEFKLDLSGDMCYTDLKLTGFGASNPKLANGNATTGRLNPVGGLYNLISVASLYMNDTLVDQVRQEDVITWMATLKGKRPDVKAEKTSFMDCSDVNVLLDPVDGIIDLAENQNTAGTVELGLVFPVLQSMMGVADCRLRVVIEYNKAAASVWRKAYQDVATWDVLRPILVSRHLLATNPEELKEKIMVVQAIKSQPVSFLSVERDYMNVASAAGGNVQLSKRIRLFEGKSLNGVFIQKSKQSDDTGVSGSVVRADKFNVIFNGARVLPYSGLDSPARQVGALLQKSEMLIPAGMIDTYTAVTQWYADAQNLLGSLAYSWVALPADKCNSLELDYQVSLTAADNYNVYLIGLVNKQLVRDGDKFDVVYA